MENFTYAHNATKDGERKSPTAQFNVPKICGKLKKLRENAFAREIPVSDDETLCLLISLVSAIKPQRILEIGTAVGISGGAMLLNCGAALTGIERDEKFYAEACENLRALGVSDRAELILGDAGEEIQKLDCKFDFIFLDCAKVQYIKYLPRLKELLNCGGVLVADDVLLYGYVTGEAPTPPKRKMLVQHIKEYIAAVTADTDFNTVILNTGNGVALSTLKV